MPREQIQWNVDAIAIEIARNVLPEVRELERRASVIREKLAGCITVTTQIQNQASNGICGIAAVIENRMPVFVSVDRLILAERRQQIAKWLDGYFEPLDCLSERNEHGLRGA